MWFKLLLVCTMFLLSVFSAVGALPVDSLKAQLSVPKKDTEQVNLLIRIATQYHSSSTELNRDSALKYANLALHFATLNIDPRGQASALYLRGTIEIAQNDYAKATTSILKGLYIAEQLQDSASISKMHLKLGLISYVLKYYDDAIKDFNVSLTYLDANKVHTKEAGQLYYLIALSFSETAKYNSALIYFAKALENYTYNSNISGEIECETYIGKMYIYSNDLEKAILHLNLAMEKNADQSPDKLARIQSFLSLAYLRKNDVTQAIRLGESAFQSGVLYQDVTTIMESSRVLQEAYRKKGEFNKAYFYLSTYKDLTDSIFNSKITERVAGLKSRYEYERRVNDEKIQHEKEKAIQQEKFERQQLTRNIYLSGFIVILIFSGVLLFQYRAKLKANDQLSETLTDLKKTQSQLIQQEKLASLGSLTSGIAHEIRNPLNFITNFSETSIDLLNELKETDDPAEREDIMKELEVSLSKINLHGKRADGIVGRMQMHSRSDTGKKELTDLNHLCRESIDLAVNGVRSKYENFHCKVDFTSDESLKPMFVVQQDLGRVILSLLNNAFHATRNVADASIKVQTQHSDEAVLITVSDNGKGIPKNIINQIFEPFFTTKPAGEGTGLGLSISHDIVVKVHHGQLTVQSEEGVGTVFTIRLSLDNLHA